MRFALTSVVGVITVSSSPIYSALTAAGQDLMGVSGKTAVLIVSDGQERHGMGSEKTIKTVPAVLVKNRLESVNFECTFF